MEKLRSKVRYYIVLSTLVALSGLCLAACGDDEETGPQGGSSGSSGDGDGDGDGDAGESGSSGDGDGDGDGDSGEGGTSGNGGDGDGDGDSGEGGDSGNGGDGDGDGDGDVEACLDAPEPTTSDEFLNRECPPSECEPFDNEERLPFYVPGEDLPDTLD